MKNIIRTFAFLSLGIAMVGCQDVVDPQTSYVTKQQNENAPGTFPNAVSTLTSSLTGQFTYRGSDYAAYDFGYPAFYIARDVTGQDISGANSDWFGAWYGADGLGPNYAATQLPWTYYFKWIQNCNTVLAFESDNMSEEHKEGVGMAYAMKAMFYLDLAQMYSTKTYLADKNALTVPYITVEQMSNAATNAKLTRLTNEEMYAQILKDLDKAETYLKNYQRADKFTPDESVVYGLKARAYLIMGDWANAKKYAGMAKEGYRLMTDAEYTNHDTGFNTPNDAWMFALTYLPTDPNIIYNDGDSSWGSQMIMECGPSGCGYASNYGQYFMIDRHLYETIPATDFRKKCFVDFSIDELPDNAAKEEALKPYTDYASSLTNVAHGASYTTDVVGGMSLKFRAAGGDAGRTDVKIGFVVAVPIMRVEEMYLIEAEAAGRLNEAEGIRLLTEFAKTRDPQYVYGKHNEAYGNTKTSAFVNEVWWQRRVELWGEGLSMYDIKRLEKGIFRSYPKTNHAETMRWNTKETPQWMTFVLPRSEVAYNTGISEINPTPSAPEKDSPEATTW